MKQNEKNGTEPAFGFVDNRSESYVDNEVHYGLTKREYFAGNAPEVPEWFNHSEPVKDYPPMPNWRDIKDIEDKNLCESWIHDGCFDLPDHLQWFSDRVNKHVEARENWGLLNAQERYFQWRTFYADRLLTQLSK